MLTYHRCVTHGSSVRSATGGIMSEDVFGDRLQLGLQPPFWVILFLIAGGAAIEAKLFGPPSGRALHERVLL